MICNPWKRIRELEARNAYLEAAYEEQFERLERTVSDAVYHGIDREVYRRRQLEAQNAILLRSSIDAANMAPISFLARESLGPQAA